MWSVSVGGAELNPSPPLLLSHFSTLPISDSSPLPTPHSTLYKTLSTQHSIKHSALFPYSALLNTPFFKVLSFIFLLLTFGAGGCVFVIKSDDIQPSKFIKMTTPAPVPEIATASSASAMEQKIHEQVNQYRASRNLPLLKLDPRISEACRTHSKAMSEGKVPFSHQGFEQRVAAIAQSIPYRSAAENVAYNLGYSDPVTQAVQGWIESPGHRKNMEGTFDLTGVGVVQNAKGEYYFTQIFIRRR